MNFRHYSPLGDTRAIPELICRSQEGGSTKKKRNKKEIEIDKNTGQNGLCHEELGSGHYLWQGGGAVEKEGT